MCSLLLKDFLVSKRYIAILLAISACIPLFLLDSLTESVPSSDVLGSIAGTLTSIYVGCMGLMQLAQKESSDHAAIALLCTTPVRRSAMVLSTYVFVFLLVAASTLIYFLESIFFPSLRHFPPLLVPSAFFLLSVILGTMISLLYRFGFDRTKAIFPVVLIAAPFVLPWILVHTPLMDMLQHGSKTLAGMLWTFGTLWLAVSFWLSLHSFERAEIA